MEVAQETGTGSNPAIYKLGKMVNRLAKVNGIQNFCSTFSQRANIGGVWRVE